MPHEILVSLQATYQSFSRSYTWLSNCLVLEYTFFPLSPMFIEYWRFLFVHILTNSWYCQTLGLFQSDWCDMAFHLYSISSFLMVGYFWLSLQWFACIYLSHIFYWTFCYCFVRVIFNIVKIVTNVSEVFCFVFLEFPNLSNSARYEPKLWILNFNILLLVNSQCAFLKYIWLYSSPSETMRKCLSNVQVNIFWVELLKLGGLQKPGGIFISNN